MLNLKLIDFKSYYTLINYRETNSTNIYFLFVLIDAFLISNNLMCFIISQNIEYHALLVSNSFVIIRLLLSFSSFTLNLTFVNQYFIKALFNHPNKIYSFSGMSNLIMVTLSVLILFI